MNSGAHVLSPPQSPVRPAPPPTAGLSDGSIDALDHAFRRVRRSLVKPPQSEVPVPSLGRPLDIAKVFACDAIAELSASGDAVTVTGVATALRLKHSTVSRLLGGIELDGLLVRGIDAKDRRRTTVMLTQTGEAVVDDARRMARFVTRAVLADWSETDVELLAGLLTRLADSAADRLATLPELARAEFCGGAALTESANDSKTR